MSLPPLPKLRPRPGLKPVIDNLPPDISITTTGGVDDDDELDNVDEEEEIIPPPPIKRPRLVSQMSEDSNSSLAAVTNEVSIIYNNNKSRSSGSDSSEKTSRLLTKNDCRGGGGRKRNSGSLIHSIPKFTQVQPRGGCISEVQKVLQTRLLEKQKLQRQKSGEDESIHKSDSMTKEKSQQQQQQHLHQQQQQLQRQHQQQRQLQQQQQKHLPDLKATNILQSIVHLHEKESTIVHATPRVQHQLSTSSSSSSISNSRKRGRKPDKSEICHLVPLEHEQPPPSTSSEKKKVEVSLTLPKSSSSQSSNGSFLLPKLSEVTITPALPKNVHGKDVERKERSVSPEIVEIPSIRKTPTSGLPASASATTTLTSPTPSSQQPVLKPEEYQSLGMPGGYIYWPSASVFVHLSAIPPQYLDFNGLPTLPLHPSVSTSSTAQKMSSPSPPTRKVDTMESLTGVMRVRPFKAAPHHPNNFYQIEKNSGNCGNEQADLNKQRGKVKSNFRVEPNTEVSICKFKFTGGAKPTLEEKKMLSVDSGGNFRYFSGSKSPNNSSPSQPANPTRSFDPSQALNLSISSTSTLTVQVPGRQTFSGSNTRRLPLGAIDLISAFEAMPERGGSGAPTEGGTRRQ